jgi:5-methyltetrahydrofolate--homocysteine methyltransferase
MGLDGGADPLLLNTLYDTLTAKAAALALDEVFKASDERLPVILSGTVTDHGITVASSVDRAV